MAPLDEEIAEWYVMRDLKRANAKLPAYKQLEEAGLEVFTPCRWRLVVKCGKRIREIVPVIQDLLFVKEVRSKLDRYVERIPTLQYRYGRGHSFRNPMTVPAREMERFIQVIRASLSPVYYQPDEITPAMYGRKIHIVGGPLNGCEGYLITHRGSKRKRLLVELHGLLAVGVEVEPEYIRFC